ncbi:UDP-2,3-diacylglucosamine hydrolase [Marinomonas spartinae]|uniref:UDP-2,3-diacylglucosamine hydrolase n=1 Tax=Marinomonas spartinae TaxID=1792290 RepID=A0A1A8T4A3_9GAMM|nr:UDP-2,3-diacylglucosamine diphosphatase [Marinomonas spartinae]SBS26768.1 UDP-2,3-diacylglucosamine hydrolase [Marinomonas spartinae]SBS40302.1 UDP-2,3-diacylglucosamine hydrolase [Marinomonas spartinae]
MQTTFRTVFISDVHLGTKACQAAHLLDFLTTIETDTLYLVGDIIDLQEMRRKAHFIDLHYRIVERILYMAKNGTQVIYIPGNHDAFFRQFTGQTLSGIEIRLNARHTTADGRHFHVSHGDEFDQMVKISPLMLAIGDRAHGAMLSLNQWINGVRRFIRLPYWSLAGYLKSHIGKAKEFIHRFETAALKSAKSKHLDGYICGHIHFASFLLKEGTLYCNDGDWVEHCTALTESKTGELNLLHWSEQPKHLATEPQDEQWQDNPLSRQPN